MYFLIPIVSYAVLNLSSRVENKPIRVIGVYTSFAGMIVGIMLTFAQVVSAQWVPIKGYQQDSLGLSYYSMDRQNAIDMCMEALRVNNVKLSTIEVDKKHDPMINNFLYKPNQPDMVYVVYVAKTDSGYVVRLIFREALPFEIEEQYMTIVYEGVE